MSFRIARAPIPRHDMIDAIRDILDFHSFEKVVVVSHSHGTTFAAHMMKEPSLAPRITAMVLVDPITFLLHLPPVAFNFVYRKPRTANEWQLWYFASRDADVARALGRHFFWEENIIWKEDILDKRVGVVLSGRDQIVDSHEVWRYLTEETEFVTGWKKDNLEVLFYPELDHAQVFDTDDRRRPMVEMVTKFTVEEGRQIPSS